MKFPNAYAGVKKIFTSEILSIISVAALLVAAIMLLIGAGGAKAGSDTATVVGLGGAGLFSIAGSVIALIAFIFQIIGVSNASKDEPAFKTALIFIITGVICAIVASFTKDNGNATTLSSIIDTVQNVSNLGVTVFIIQGIRNLADRLNNGAVSAKGATIFKIIIAIYALIIIASIVAIFSLTIAGIIAIIVPILNLIQYIFFLSLLAQAKKMLA